MMKLRINPFFTVDLKNMKESIAEDNPDASQQIQQFPNLGAAKYNAITFRRY